MNAKTQTEVASTFAVLSAVDCSEHVEHKGKFAYLSWPYAVGELLKRYPAATWRVIETPDGLPYWKDEAGAFVKCAVTVEGIERVQIHPVLNGNNKTIVNPNAFEVNTSIQRGIVKAMALHGLGLYIYAGEDLPAAEKEKRGEPDGDAPEGSHSTQPGQPMHGVWDGLDDKQRQVIEATTVIVGEYMETGDAQGAYEYLESQIFATEEKAALWSILPSKTRTAFKKLKQERPA
jgi:hypothetical protein